MGDTWWDDADWYDLHDNTSMAGVEREPEHYREFVIALPPIGPDDHVADFGAGTGKLSLMVAQSYPGLGRLTLVEPNPAKLARAHDRLSERLGLGRVTAVAGALGKGSPPDIPAVTQAIVGSVFMPVVLGAASLASGRRWLDRALREARELLAPEGVLWDLETVAMPWDAAGSEDRARRLTLPELTDAFVQTGHSSVECRYRFRDRVVLMARR